MAMIALHSRLVALSLLVVATTVACEEKKRPPPVDLITDQPGGKAATETASTKATRARDNGNAPTANMIELGYSGSEAARAAAADCPGAQDGSELVGSQAKEWQLTDWVHSDPLTLAQLRGRVVLVRFWMSPTCPYCEATMPAIQTLSEEFKDAPVTFIGALHGKPYDQFSDMTEPTNVAKSWGVTFPLAFDREWKTQRLWWMDGKHRHATSETFLIGKDGKIVHIHPGPVFFPSDDPANAQQNRDYLEMQAAIRKALES